MSDDWKARAEKAEAKVDELSLELARTWTRLWSSEAACAEMRALLDRLYCNDCGSRLNIAACDFTVDAGKGWVSPEEHARAVMRGFDAGWDKRIEREKAVGWAPPEVVAQAIEALEDNEPIDPGAYRLWAMRRAAALQALRLTT